jgi:hypothetical protein
MPGTTLFTKLAISKISEILVSSPRARAEFSKGPSDFFAKHLRVAPSADEAKFLETLKQQLADGNCCTGCNCPGGLLSPEGDPVFGQ